MQREAWQKSGARNRSTAFALVLSDATLQWGSWAGEEGEVEGRRCVRAVTALPRSPPMGKIIENKILTGIANRKWRVAAVGSVRGVGRRGGGGKIL